MLQKKLEIVELHENSRSISEKDKNIAQNKILIKYDASAKPEDIKFPVNKLNSDENKTETAIFGTKKKKKTKQNIELDPNHEKTNLLLKPILDNSESLDSDYTYDELLDRAYCILRTCNPKLKGERKKNNSKATTGST